ncbi:MAG: M50 family metallopeptidase [Bacteroidales bacterium]|jgi:hypothetical protein|nr:M50 family metallopeptidase [Bacteroidales bacterium]
MRDLLSNKEFVFYAVLTVCFGVMYIPVVGKYIRVLETMIHESGHVLMALLTGAKISKINLFSDTSGETHIMGAGKIKTMFIAWVGYPFSSAMAWLSFWAIDSNYKQIFIIILCVLTCIFLVAYIRNGFGIFWAISFILANGYLLYKKKTVIIEILASIYADILFLSSLFSCFIILYLSFKYPNKAGDATLISKITHIPPQIIAIIFVVLCGVISLSTMKNFFPLFDHLKLF